MRDYLLQSLEMAKKRQGFCAPNPAVGAVVVKNHQVIATGLHQGAGQPHAEVDALKSRDDWPGATLYVTLEPCCHQGRTPPCTDLIIAARIQCVVFAFKDPNPQVAGKGQAALLAAGIACVHHPLPEIDLFYRSYCYWTRYRRPWVRLKLALSADNKIAAEHGKPAQITGQACHQLTHQYRLHSDEILTSINTIIKDNPRMNVRLSDQIIAKPVSILDRRLQLNRDALIFQTASQVTIYRGEAIEVADDDHSVAVPVTKEGLVLSWVLDDLGRRGVHDLWVEVGAQLSHAFYQHQLINELILYRSSIVLGESALAALPFDDQFLEKLASRWQSLGEDEMAQLTIRGHPAKFLE